MAQLQGGGGRGRAVPLGDAAQRSSTELWPYAGGAERSDGRRGRKTTAGVTSDPDTRARAGSDTGEKRSAGWSGPLRLLRAFLCRPRKKGKGPGGLKEGERNVGRQDSARDGIFGKRKDLFFSLFFMDSNQSSNSN